MSITYLYVKQHQKTKLKYFGKTTSRDPYKYKGSGLHWLRHLKKHGADVYTLEVWGFDDEALCTQFALRFSEEHDIVKSSEWANIVSENGVDGQPKGWVPSLETRKNMSASRKANPKTIIACKKASEAAAIVNRGKKRPDHSKLLSENPPRADTKVYIFKKGLTNFTGTRVELARAFPEDKIDPSGLSCLISGRYKSHRGWTVV